MLNLALFNRDRNHRILMNLFQPIFGAKNDETASYSLVEAPSSDFDGVFHAVPVPAGYLDIKVEEIDVPENVRLIIGRRLERLDENERRVLAAAAVIGRSFSFQLLTEISRIDVDELFTVIEKAQQMGIIVPSAEGPERPYAFGHELGVRRSSPAYWPRARSGCTLMSPTRSSGLNASAVNERAEEIADHLLKAGSFADDRRLVRYLMLAGKTALEAAAYEEARRSFQSALLHLTDVEAGRDRADLLASVAIAERGLEHWEAAFTRMQEALDIYITLGDRERIAESCTELTSIFVWAGRIQEAVETAHRGLSYLHGDLSAGRARFLAVLGQAQATAGTWEPANEALCEALKIASHLSDPKLIAGLHRARLTSNFQFLRLSVADGEKSRGSDAPP